jgi:REP element-mobilizing transposase RayT
MKYDPLRHHRRSTRLPGHDYASPGAYFVTVCTRGRLLHFEVSAVRAFAETCWLAIPDHAPRVTVDEWVVMPNHVHGIIVINEPANETADVSLDHRRGGVQLNAPTANANDESRPNLDSTSRDAASPFSRLSPRRHTLSVIVRTYKAAVTTAARRAGHTDFAWQRGFYEHIIRGPRELDSIRRYIRDNPRQWDLDRDNPANRRHLPPPATIQDYLSELAASTKISA